MESSSQAGTIRMSRRMFVNKPLRTFRRHMSINSPNITEQSVSGDRIRRGLNAIFWGLLGPAVNIGLNNLASPGNYVLNRREVLQNGFISITCGFLGYNDSLPAIPSIED